MAKLKYHKTERDRVCKLCGETMSRATWGLVMRDVHVSPKTVDLHFHEACFRSAFQQAKDDRYEQNNPH